MGWIIGDCTTAVLQSPVDLSADDSQISIAAEVLQENFSWTSMMKK